MNGFGHLRPNNLRVANKLCADEMGLVVFGCSADLNCLKDCVFHSHPDTPLCLNELMAPGKWVLLF